MIFSVTKWINHQGCGQTALQIVRELLGLAGAGTLTKASMDTFVEAIKVGFGLIFLFSVC